MRNQDILAEPTGERSLRLSTPDGSSGTVPLPEHGSVRAPLGPVFGRVKRVLDVGGALVLGTVALPLILALCVLIRLDSPGPPIYWRVRLGHNGTPFRCLKFRSMHHD